MVLRELGHHWFRKRLLAYSVSSHRLNQWWHTSVNFVSQCETLVSKKKTSLENVEQLAAILFRRQQSGIVGGRWLWWNYHQLKDSKYIHLTVYMIIGPYKGICRHCSNNVSDIKICNKWQREWHTTFWFFVLLICHVRNTNVQDSSVLHILSAETYHMAIFWHTNIKDFQWWLK